MTKYYLIIPLLLLSGNIFAQKNSSLKTYEKIDVGINGFGLALETPLNQKILSEFYIGLGPSYDLHEDISINHSMSWHWTLLEPSFHASVYGKYYYNRENRMAKGKSLLLNSGNFIGLKVKYISKSLSDPSYYSNTILANLNWGLQRNLGKHWVYDFSFGLGYGYNMDNPYSMLYPALDLKIAYVFPFFDKKK